MYNIYKYDYANNKSTMHTRHLNLLRLDVTENEIYKHRFVNSTCDVTHHRDCKSTITKIGFLSDDFRESRPSGQLSVTFFEILKNYKDHFKIYFYTRTHLSSRFKNYAIIRHCKHKNRHIESYNLEKMILEDNIDMLFDMQGHMHNNYNDILSKKMAPIVCHWLGYPGTIGIPSIDYIFADSILIPDTSQKYYREKIAYFPNCYQPNNEELLVTSKPSRVAFNIPENAFVFCHFNSDYKLDKKMWLVMLDIVKQTPNSILMFKTTSQSFKNRLISDAKLYGVNIEQLLCVERLFITSHVHRLSACNLGLDNFRLNGHTTSSDLIAAGIPFVAYPGNTYHNRVSKSILRSLSLDELCTNSYNEYIKVAVKLATDTSYYSNIVDKLVQNRSKTLFNSQLYTNHFVSIMHNMWKKNYNETIQYVWIFYVNYDSPGNDICVTDKREKELLDVVNNVPGCIAYTTNGHLKSAILDKSEWTKLDDNSKLYNTGLWVKEVLQEYNITEFGNNHKDKKYKWTFFKDKDSVGSNIKHVNERHQILRDIAEKDEKCVGFNLKGDLKHAIGPPHEWITDVGNGLWVRKEDIVQDQNMDNMDYQLPLIVIYASVHSLTDYKKMVSYCANDLYLNKKVLLLIDASCVDLKRISKYIQQEFNIHYTINEDGETVENVIKDMFPTADCYLQYNNDNIQHLYDENINQFFLNKLK